MAETPPRTGPRAQVLAALARAGALWMEDVRSRWFKGDKRQCSRFVTALCDAGLVAVRQSRRDGRRRYLVLRPEGTREIAGMGLGAPRYAGSRLPAAHTERMADQARIYLCLRDAGFAEAEIALRAEVSAMFQLPRDRCFVASVARGQRCAVFLQPPLRWRRVVAPALARPLGPDLWVVLTDSPAAWRQQVSQWLDRTVARRVWVPRPGEAVGLIREYLDDPGAWERRLRDAFGGVPGRSRKGPALAIPGFQPLWPRTRDLVQESMCVLDGRLHVLQDFRGVPVDTLSRLSRQVAQQVYHAAGVVGVVCDEKQAQQVAGLLGWAAHVAYLWAGQNRACLWTVKGKHLIARQAQAPGLV